MEGAPVAAKFQAMVPPLGAVTCPVPTKFPLGKSVQAAPNGLARELVEHPAWMAPPLIWIPKLIGSACAVAAHKIAPPKTAAVLKSFVRIPLLLTRKFFLRLC